MNPDELQVDYEEGHDPETDHTGSLSDDDIASALGFHTTLSEPLIPQDAGTDAEGEATQTADESLQTAVDAGDVNQASAPPADHDDEQDAEIQDIRNQLEALLKQEDGTKTEDTGTVE